MTEQVLPSSAQLGAYQGQPTTVSEWSFRPVSTTWRSNHQLRTRAAERGCWDSTPEAAGQQTPSKLAASDTQRGLQSCAREPNNHPHRPQASGDTPTLNPGDLEVTAEMLSCGPWPRLLLLAWLYFQNAFADSGSTKVGTVHTSVDMHALSSTAFWSNITDLTTELHHTQVYWISPSLVKGALRTAQRKYLKTQKRPFMTWWLLSAVFGTSSWCQQQVIIKCACVTDADFTCLLIYNHVYFYLVYIYIYLCLFTSSISVKC